ncbi:MAG: hydrogenase maturation nickel metallochaperone HypA [Candidatus Heimdallarchaeum aukensis]|uniref:Hydrogenase maturation factor HypA n=1 Tax=Candidatus Heimdallarchaeum aukensis TaxID=2876573 RepID=A0A9Y1BMN2_9ARCH|nr:MAG: hydrogenase maturation nickel metallochaperone HypA [Candidatus Heimdallarchaeum aukensis]
MHEYSLASAIVDQVEQIALEHKAVRVKKIIVSASPYELIIPELLYGAYEIIISERDMFKGSTLEYKVQKAEITCLDCGYQGEPDEEGDPEFAYNFKCPKCGGRDTHINMKSMVIESIDLEIPSKNEEEKKEEVTNLNQ